MEYRNTIWSRNIDDTQSSMKDRSVGNVMLEKNTENSLDR
jgi:hypothetical protein